jgi:hypothetical protein
MLALYAGWRLPPRVCLFLLDGAIAAAIAVGHRQRDVGRAPIGHGSVERTFSRLDHQVQRGLERHLRPFDGSTH